MTPDDAIARRSGPIRRSWLASRCRAGETILELPTPTTSLDRLPRPRRSIGTPRVRKTPGAPIAPRWLGVSSASPYRRPLKHPLPIGTARPNRY